MHRPIQTFLVSFVLGILIMAGTTANAAQLPLGVDPATRVDATGARAYAPAASAQTPHGQDGLRSVPPASWSALGPFGGDVQTVGVSPTNASLMLAGLAPAAGSGLLFRSTDAGATWTNVTSMAGYSFYDLAFTPTGIAYVATTESVWKSTDGGVTWTHLNLGIGVNDVALAIRIDPTNASNLWVGVSDALGGQTQTVLKSTNGGTSWTNKTPPMSPMACRGIAIDPANTNKVYACFGGDFGGGSVWVSTNGGTNWTNRSSGLPANPMNDIMKVGARLYLCGGMLFGTQEVGLYASTNDGATWTSLHNPGWPSKIIRDMDIDPTNPAVILVGSDGRGVFKSTDSGTTWSYGIGGSGNLSVRSVHYAPGSSTRIALGLSSLGVYQSVDGGDHFQASSNGIGALNVFSIASNPMAPNEIAICFQGNNDGGVYTSVDSGQTWMLENCPTTRWNTVRFSDWGILYAISDGPSTVAPEGVYRRAPDSGVWTCLGPDQGSLFESELYGLTFSHTNPNLILSSGADFGVAGSEDTCWLSTDAGATWTKAYEGSQSSCVYDVWLVDDGTDQTAVGCVTNFSGGPGGAVRSVDGGANWVNSSGGLPATVRGIDLDAFPGSPNTIYYADMYYAIGGGGLYKTTDEGLTWTSAGYGGTGSVNAVVCDVARPGVIYITRPDPEKVLVSTDGGATFAPFNTGLTGTGTATKLAYAGGPARLLLATSTTSCVTRLLDPAGIEGSLPSNQARMSIYPNPLPSGRGVRIEMPAGSAKDLRIYDATGRLVRSLDVHGSVVNWDGANDGGAQLPAGIYFVRSANAGVVKIELLR